MRPASCLLLSTALLLAACSPSGADGADSASAAPRVDVAAEEQAIRALDARLLEAVQRRDTTAIAAFYATSGLTLMPGVGPLRGPEGARRAWGRRLAAPGASTRFAPTVVDVAAEGDMAWEVGTYTSTAGRRAQQGKYVHVWRKFGPDWKIVAHAFSDDAPAR